MTRTPDLPHILHELKQLTGIDLTSSDFDSNATLELQKLCTAYREKYDRTYFFQNIIRQRLSSQEISEQAAKLHIDAVRERRLLLLETHDVIDDALLSVLKHLFPAQSGAQLFPFTEQLLVLLYPVPEKGLSESEVYQLACSISDTLNMELMISVKIVCGPQISHLTKLSDAFEKASLSLKVGKLFLSEQTVFSYDQLGAGRLIYHLPSAVCKDFLREVFRGKIPGMQDPEMLTTVNRFLQNNMNIAETARQLHMHRNTLIYRIEQVETQTGLDIRTFEDAMTYKLALMVMNYINENKGE